MNSKRTRRLPLLVIFAGGVTLAVGLSLATMLICTNDGFGGLNRVRLPPRVQRVFPLYGYDAGTEDNAPPDSASPRRQGHR